MLISVHEVEHYNGFGATKKKLIHQVGNEQPIRLEVTNQLIFIGKLSL